MKLLDYQDILNPEMFTQSKALRQAWDEAPRDDVFGALLHDPAQRLIRGRRLPITSLCDAIALGEVIEGRLDIFQRTFHTAQ